MKNYNVTEVATKLSKVSGVSISGKKVTVSSSQGIGTWGKLDYLKNYAGYSLNITNGVR